MLFMDFYDKNGKEMWENDIITVEREAKYLEVRINNGVLSLNLRK